MRKIEYKNFKNIFFFAVKKYDLMMFMAILMAHRRSVLSANEQPPRSDEIKNKRGGTEIVIFNLIFSSCEVTY